MRKNILFDMDGVLVDSEPVITRAAVEGLRSFSIPAQAEDFLPFTGMGEDMFLGGVARKYGVEYTPAMKVKVYQLYGKLVDSSLRVYAHTLDTLRALKAARCHMALASSADYIKIEHNLRVAHIPRDTFDVVIGGEDVKRKKPFPDIYELAAVRMGVPPTECFVVEDAVSGVGAGKAAGAQVIAVTTSFPYDRLMEAGADYVVGDLGEIVEIICGRAAAKK